MIYVQYNIIDISSEINRFIYENIFGVVCEYTDNG